MFVERCENEQAEITPSHEKPEMDISQWQFCIGARVQLALHPEFGMVQQNCHSE